MSRTVRRRLPAPTLVGCWVVLFVVSALVRAITAAVLRAGPPIG